MTGEARLLGGLLPAEDADSTDDDGDIALFFEEAGPGLLTGGVWVNNNQQWNGNLRRDSFIIYQMHNTWH